MQERTAGCLFSRRMGRRTIGVFHAAPDRASVTRAAEGPTRGSAEQIATIGVLRQLVRKLAVGVAQAWLDQQTVQPEVAA